MDHDCFIWLDAVSFEPLTGWCFEIQLTDVQHSTVRQNVARANCENATARLCADNRGAFGILESGNKDLGSAGGAFAGQDSERDMRSQGLGGEETCWNAKGGTGAVSEFTQIHSASEKS